jgi:Transcriptional regulator, AbiEi antitoxin
VADDSHLCPNGCGQRAPGGDRAVAELADRQHGVVSHDQLLRVGLSRRAIEHRIGRGRLFPIHRGVYAVGRAGLGNDGRWMAAVLAAGRDAVLSHLSAAGLWALRHYRHPITHVTSPRRRRGRRHVIVHQASLPADEVTVELGIPVTTVARTLFDFASYAPRAELELAINEAERRGLADAPSLPELIERYPRHKGVLALRSALGDGWVGLGVARSVFEERFLAFVRKAGLPQPEVNVSVHASGQWFEVDFSVAGPTVDRGTGRPRLSLQPYCVRTRPRA